MGIIDLVVLLFFVAGIVFAYLVAGAAWSDRNSGTDTGLQGLRQFFKTAVAGYAWPVSVFVWVWKRFAKPQTTTNKD